MPRFFHTFSRAPWIWIDMIFVFCYMWLLHCHSSSVTTSIVSKEQAFIFFLGLGPEEVPKVVGKLLKWIRYIDTCLKLNKHSLPCPQHHAWPKYPGFSIVQCWSPDSRRWLSFWGTSAWWQEYSNTPLGLKMSSEIVTWVVEISGPSSHIAKLHSRMLAIL